MIIIHYADNFFFYFCQKLHAIMSDYEKMQSNSDFLYLLYLAGISDVTFVV